MQNDALEIWNEIREILLLSGRPPSGRKPLTVPKIPAAIIATPGDMPSRNAVYSSFSFMEKIAVPQKTIKKPAAHITKGSHRRLKGYMSK